MAAERPRVVARLDVPEVATFRSRHAIVEGDALVFYGPDATTRVDLASMRITSVEPPRETPEDTRPNRRSFAGNDLRAYVDAGEGGVEVKSAEGVARHAMAKTRSAQAAILWDLGADLGLQIGDQTLCAIDRHLARRWEVRVRPYVYDVLRVSDATVAIGTAGNGGYLYDVDAGSGAIRARTKLRGGAHGLVRDRDEPARLLASGAGDAMLFDDRRLGEDRARILRVKGAFRVVHFAGDRAALLTCVPAGIVFVAIDDQPPAGGGDATRAAR